MVKRPAWSIKGDRLICESFEFEWNEGFAITQKQKNIANFHNAIRKKYKESALEVSSKGTVQTGKALSAFSLKYKEDFLENVFQSSKKYERGGPYIDLLKVTPKEAKQDKLHKSSGKLTAFCFDNEEWQLEPKTAFYDYIYVTAVLQKYRNNLDLSKYDWFTDIEFNPNRSINCQARAVAIYKLIQSKNLFDVTNKKDVWLEFHKEYMKG